MAIKFIDKNRKDEICGDEIITRCSCGCGMLSFSIFKDKNGSNEEYKVLIVQHFGNSITDKKRSIASCLYYPGDQGPSVIAGLINGSINDGNGVIEDVDGGLLMVETNIDEEFGKSIVIAGFYDERSFKKYMRNPEKGLKYLAWNIHLEEKEANKLSETINKNFNKELGYEISKENIK